MRGRAKEEVEKEVGIERAVVLDGRTEDEGMRVGRETKRKR